MSETSVLASSPYVKLDPLEALQASTQAALQLVKQTGKQNTMEGNPVIQIEPESILKALARAEVTPQNNVLIRCSPETPKTQKFLQNAFGALDAAQDLKSSLRSLIANTIKAIPPKSKNAEELERKLIAEKVLAAISA